MTTTTEPTTLTDVATQLEHHRQAIAERRDYIGQAEDAIRTAEADIAEHEKAARGLLARHNELVKASFGVEPKKGSKASTRRASSNGGATSPDYAARTAKRLATIARKKEEAERAKAEAAEPAADPAESPSA